jgi:hypothetical protein
MSEDAIVVSEDAHLATMKNPPEAVLAEAKKAAVALQDVIASKPKKVIIGDRQYIEFDDWQTLGRFYGITVGSEKEPEFVSFATDPDRVEVVRGFKATSVAMFNGNVISRATGYCLNDEEKWRDQPKYEWHYVLRSGGTSLEDPGKDEIIWVDNPNKPGKKRPERKRVQVGVEAVHLCSLASMAQTRANAKALRNVLSWVAVLAGYQATPAEEMPVEAEVVQTSKGDVKVGKGRGKKTPHEEALPGDCPQCGSKNVGVSEKGENFCGNCGFGGWE